MGNEHAGNADSPLPLGSPQLAGQVAALAEQVRRLGERSQAGPRGAQQPPAPAVPAAELLASAERAAEKIRESARREAARIAAGTGPRPNQLAAELLVIVNRQRQTLAVLAAEAERLGQATDVLEAKIRALDGDLQAMYERLGAAPRPPVWPGATAPPAASRDTSPRPPE